MEALTSASVALLTVWDSEFDPAHRRQTTLRLQIYIEIQTELLPSLFPVVKAVAGKEMVIEGLMVVRKSGGKSGDWQRDLDASPPS